MQKGDGERKSGLSLCAPGHWLSRKGGPALFQQSWNPGSEGMGFNNGAHPQLSDSHLVANTQAPPLLGPGEMWGPGEQVGAGVRSAKRHRSLFWFCCCFLVF